MVLILSKSSVVHITAQHRSLPIAAYLTYDFSHLGVANMLLDSVGIIFAEQGKTVREGDVLIAICFSPYANEVLKLAGIAQDRSIPVIVITDSILGSLGFFSDVYVELKETDVFGFRGVVLGALMCHAFSLMLELVRRIEQQKKEDK